MTEGTIQIPEGKVGFDDETPTGEKNTKQKQIKISCSEFQFVKRRDVSSKIRCYKPPFYLLLWFFFYLWRKVLSYQPDTNLILKMTLLHTYVKKMV